MNKKVFNTILFATGVIIGSVATWVITKTRYERIVQEEIDSVREEYCRLSNLMKQENDESQNETEEIENNNEYVEESTEYEFTDQEKVEYSKIANKYRVLDDSNDGENDEEGDDGDEVQSIDGPYVISPEEFNSSPPGYNVQPLDYFIDGVLADSWGVQLDIEETIGEDALDHFGEYADDLVYVRNDREEIDYEVTKDPRTYSESIRMNPYYNQ